MAIDTGSTSPNGSKLSGRCQPYVDVYQITPGSGGFTVYYRIGMYCYTINWSARNYTVTCTGATSQTKSMSFKGGNNSSQTYIQGASGSFWVSNPTGAHDAYNEGDKCTYQKVKYISLINGNTTVPGIDDRYWEVVND